MAQSILTGGDRNVTPMPKREPHPDHIKLLEAQISELRTKFDAEHQRCVAQMASEAQLRVEVANERARADVAVAKQFTAEQSATAQQRRAEVALAECEEMKNEMRGLNNQLGAVRQQLGRAEGEVASMRSVQPPKAESSDDDSEGPIVYVVNRNELGDIMSITATPRA